MPLDGAFVRAAAFHPRNKKPSPWEFDTGLTQHPLTNTLVAPFWPGATAYWNGTAIRPADIAGGIKARVTRRGQSYGGASDNSSTDWIDYPSALFDQSSISALTLVALLLAGKAKSAGAGGSADGIMDATVANNDGFRAFLAHGAASDGCRWRVPEAAGNVDITGADWSAGDFLQFVGLLGGGTQRAELWNASTATLYSAESATTSSITMDEGTVTVLNAVDHDRAALPGDILAVYLTIGRRWTADEILRNRHDPFSPLRPDPLRVTPAFRVPAAGGATVTPSLALLGVGV